MMKFLGHDHHHPLLIITPFIMVLMTIERTPGLLQLRIVSVCIEACAQRADIDRGCENGNTTSTTVLLARGWLHHSPRLGIAESQRKLISVITKAKSGFTTYS